MKYFSIVFLLLTSDGFAKSFNSKVQKFQTEILTEKGDVIWGFDFLTPDEIIFTERTGKLKLLKLKTKGVTEISGVPEVFAKGQGGLMDIRVFKDKKIFFSYSEPVGRLSTTSLASAEIDGKKLKNFKKIFSASPATSSRIQFGSRIEFDRAGHLFLTVGDHDERRLVQKNDSDLGKVLRFSIDEGDKKEIWAKGFRSPEGLVMDQQGQLWMSDMGPKGGDEINIIEKDRNYGWPDVTYGKEYTGLPIGPGSKDGVTDPIVYWVPSISPSGITFYTGTKLAAWTGNLFVCALSGKHLRRLTIKENKVTDQEELMADENERFRNVRTGPDGFLYYSTDSGMLGRIVPF